MIQFASCKTFIAKPVRAAITDNSFGNFTEFLLNLFEYEAQIMHEEKLK